jgi:putative Mg2+ transporter-C (MgtC) family protein
MNFLHDWLAGGSDLIKLAIAYCLALPVGWYREHEAHTIGLRTFPVVAMASCGYVLLGSSAAGIGPDGQSRIIQGLITGIGFVGGGAILKSENQVRGTATAASIWCTGVVGAAVAQNRYLLAAALAALNLFALRVLMPLKERLSASAPNPPVNGPTNA